MEKIDKTIKKIKNPYGGESIAYYFNNGVSCEPEEATETLVHEYDKNGKMIHSYHFEN